MIRARGTRDAESSSLQSRLDDKRNGFNLLRLVLASLVIVTHAAVVTTGSQEPRGLFDVAVGQMPVDGFFGLSGFLITRSWLSRPSLRSFAMARAARLLPGFWLCLVLTAGFFYPVWLIMHGSLSSFDGVATVEYVVHNAGLIVFSNDIAGTPVGVPYEGDWNASLWTLKWEAACYAVVALLGVSGAFGRHKWLLFSAFGILLASNFLVGYTSSPYIIAGVRFATMFGWGSFLWIISKRVRLNLGIALVALVVLCFAVAYLPNYRAMGALPFVYILLYLGCLLKFESIRLPNDLSYGIYVYGFPVEQILATSELRELPVVAFAFLALLGALPFAIVSWFGCERPIMRWARRILMSRSPGSDAVPG